ncbi:GDCCVxC domain-containing (seleno)protein [Candidatus Spongiihabitans sp.]|uniref:GDCCVxC domain-containing (seleno)protein n=1 Tax=Candidatus Spongiihabitans sp. TaxID=3101308 RepID=UPI003C6F1A59
MDTIENVILQSTITCPHCNHEEQEIMPTNMCQWYYDCKGCGILIKPKPDDCCVFCSYSTEACPPMQLDARCCIRKS